MLRDISTLTEPGTRDKEAGPVTAQHQKEALLLVQLIISSCEQAPQPAFAWPCQDVLAGDPNYINMLCTGTKRPALSPEDHTTRDLHHHSDFANQKPNVSGN